MELRIKPAQRNNYLKRALLIKGASPFIWFQEMEAMQVNIDTVEAFAVPSTAANVLYGCVLIFKIELPEDYRNHKPLQCAYDKILIPEQADLYPKLTQGDIDIMKAKWIIAHPNFGFVDLEEPIDWLHVLEKVPETEMQITQPATGINIPKNIYSYSIEMDDDQLLDSLQAPLPEAEWMKSLPFNLQKVLNGNKREVEKYLKYLEQHPEHALSLGVPLDIMSTSRDDGWASFSFKDSWLGGLLGGRGRTGSSRSGGGGYDGGSNFSPAWSRAKYSLLAASLLIFIFRMLNSKNEPNNFRYDVPAATSTTASTERTYNYNGQNIVIPDNNSIGKINGDSTLEQKKKARLSKYMATTTQYANEISHGFSEKRDSLRKNIAALSKEIKSIDAEMALKNGLPKSGNAIALEQELASAEATFSKQIVDSFERNSDLKNMKSASFAELYEKELHKKKQQFRDSFSKQNAAAVDAPSALDPLPHVPNETKSVGLFYVIMIVGGLMAMILVYIKFIRQKNISLGGDAIAITAKLFLVAALTGLLAYIFFPLISRYGYNWAVWLLFAAVAALLYRLFSSDKTILKTGKDG